MRTSFGELENHKNPSILATQVHKYDKKDRFYTLPETLPAGSDRPRGFSQEILNETRIYLPIQLRLARLNNFDPLL